MKPFICFYLKSGKIVKRPNFDIGKSEILEIESKRRVRIKEGYEFVTFDYDYQRGYFFNEYGRITKVEPPEKEDQIELKTYRFHLLTEFKLKENNHLSDLVYSLTNVFNYKYPHLHFNRIYTSIDEINFKSITEGRLFLSRTAFGTLINSLPEYHVKTFVEKLIDKGLSNFFIYRDYQSAFKELRTYIKSEIEKRGEMLIASEEMLRENFSDQVNITKIGFGDNNSSKIDLLSEQVKKFKELFAIEKEFEMWESIQSEIRENSENENYFNENFSKIDWPIKYQDL